MTRPAVFSATTALLFGILWGCSTAIAQEAGKNASPSGQGAQAPQGAALPATPSVPSPETLLALVRTNLVALDHACRTGNFSVLRDLSGPFLRSKLSVDALASSFVNVCASRADLVAVSIVTPTLTEPPALMSNGMLRLVGTFAIRPSDLRFEMLFEAATGEWRLAGMNVAAAGRPAEPSQRAVTAPAAEPKPSASDGKVAKKKR